MAERTWQMRPIPAAASWPIPRIETVADLAEWLPLEVGDERVEYALSLPRSHQALWRDSFNRSAKASSQSRAAANPGGNSRKDPASSRGAWVPEAPFRQDVRRPSCRA